MALVFFITSSLTKRKLEINYYAVKGKKLSRSADFATPLLTSQTFANASEVKLRWRAARK